MKITVLDNDIDVKVEHEETEIILMRKHICMSLLLIKYVR
jgi:hypothetical protein